MIDAIVPSSAGTVAVAAIALTFATFQFWLSLKRSEFHWSRWAGALSVVTVVFAVAVFIQFNSPAGRMNHLAELMQYAAVLLMVHCVYGFTFAYLALPSSRYHQIAGAFHALLLVTLFQTDLIIADQFVQRDFLWLEQPYVEPLLGPLGPFYTLYCAIAGTSSLYFWFRHRGHWKGQAAIFMVGFLFWALFALHDAAVTLGLPTVQYLLVYGFLGFSTAIVWVNVRTTIDLYELAEVRERELNGIRSELEVRVSQRTEELQRVNRKLRAEIAERKKSADALRKSEERLLQAQAVAQVGNWELDLKTGSMWGSQQAAEIYGMGGGSRQLPAEQIWKMTHTEDRAILDTALKDLIDKNRKYDVEFRMFRAGDNAQRWIHSKAELRMDSQGRAAKVLGAIQDITERKAAEQEKERLHKKLSQAQKMEVIGTLAGGVAHDLNNILSGIVSFPELILMDLPDDSPLRESVLAIKNSGEKAATIVHDLLTLARRGVEATEVVNLNQAVNEYLTSYEFAELEKRHPRMQVKKDLGPSLLNMLGSPVHLSKTIMNLVSNAAEAMPGGGDVTITTRNLYVDRPFAGYDDVAEGEYVALTVADAGVGISEENLKRIFEPFYTKKVMGKSGSGLGMAVVWGTVKDHRGYIDVDSTEGEGTSVRLYFPVTRLESSKETNIPIESYTGSGQQILVVDDVREQREIASKMLEKLNYRVDTVDSGEAALEHLKNNLPDLLVLDMIMDPGIDGFETYRRILEIHPKQRAIIASGFAENKRVRNTQKLGAGKYIKKPYTLEKIGIAVKQELDR